MALSGKELGDELRRTPRGRVIWCQRRESKDPVKRGIGRPNRATQNEKPMGRLGNQSQVLIKDGSVRTGRKSGSGEEERGTRPGRFKVRYRLTKEGVLFGGNRNLTAGGGA